MKKPDRSKAAIVLSLVCTALLSACGQTDDQDSNAKPPVIRPVKTIIIQPTLSRLQRTYSAIVLPSQQVELSFRVSGRIVELPIRGGMEIKKGDVVAQLDRRDFRAEITRLESQLEQAEAQMNVLTAGARAEDVASLTAAVAAAQAQADAAKDQVTRSRQLFDKGVVAKSKLDNDLTAQRVAEADLKAKEQELIKGQAGARDEDVAAQEAVIRGLESQLASLNDTLSDTTLRAPFDGIIARRQVENFVNIQANETVATLQQLSKLDLGFDVPGPDVVKFSKVRELDLKVHLDSFPGREFVASRSEFSTQADASTQTYRGRVSIDNPDGESILPGMSGNLTVTAKQQSAAIYQVPGSALASQADGNPFVWVVNPADNKVARRDVVTGNASGADISVSEGLNEGDIVVTAGVSALQENMLVRPVKAIGE